MQFSTVIDLPSENFPVWVSLSEKAQISTSLPVLSLPNKFLQLNPLNANRNYLHLMV